LETHPRRMWLQTVLVILYKVCLFYLQRKRLGQIY
jgi:hypothetical protein